MRTLSWWEGWPLSPDSSESAPHSVVRVLVYLALVLVVCVLVYLALVLVVCVLVKENVHIAFESMHLSTLHLVVL